jgi:hypothetical protein
VHPSIIEQLGHVDERVAVLLRRRRVHDNEGTGLATDSAIQAEITAEAGIGRGWAQRVDAQAVRGGQCAEPVA